MYLSADEKISIRLNRLEGLNQELTLLLYDQILFSKIDFSDVPQIIRLSKRTLYCAACRVSSLDYSIEDCSKPINLIKLMLIDIESLRDEHEYDYNTYVSFLGLFSNFIQYVDETFSGDKKYETFKKTIPKKLLLELRV